MKIWCPRFGSKLRKRLAGFFLATGLVISSASLVSANPTGPTVQHGQVHITPGIQTQIQQLTSKAIIDWRSFSIGSSESVHFLQPSDLAVILNRVTGGDPSVILGQMRANGNVFLINSSGILFGPNSRVNVGGLVASTLDISNQDFLSGNHSFVKDPTASLASVVNQGTITVTDGGYAILTGSNVVNEGTIIARSGHVVLAAGERSTLNLDGRDLVHFALGSETAEGTVLLAPGTLSETLSRSLGIGSERQAHQLIRSADGRVLLASSSGAVQQAGRIITSEEVGPVPLSRALINAQTPPTEPTEPVETTTTLVEIVLIPRDDVPLINPTIFAPDNTDFVEEDLKELERYADPIDDIKDPTETPSGWWDDEEFMRHKNRR
jgi:filamentous hemagglutinin family protein